MCQYTTATIDLICHQIKGCVSSKNMFLFCLLRVQAEAEHRHYLARGCDGGIKFCKVFLDLALYIVKTPHYDSVWQVRHNIPQNSCVYDYMYKYCFISVSFRSLSSI